jgi:hypothetical protein
MQVNLRLQQFNTHDNSKFSLLNRADMDVLEQRKVSGLAWNLTPDRLGSSLGKVTARSEKC